MDDKSGAYCLLSSQGYQVQRASETDYTECVNENRSAYACPKPEPSE